jgi:hypothetical protein
MRSPAIGGTASVSLAPGHDLSPTIVEATTGNDPSGDLPGVQYGHDSHTYIDAGKPLSPAVTVAAPDPSTRGVLDRGQPAGGTRTTPAPVDPPNGAAGQVVGDTQNWPVGGAPASADSAPDTQGAGALAASFDGRASAPADALLLICADALDDLERVRIANENRLRSLRDVKGMGGTTAEARLEALTAGLAELEHGATLELQRAMRAHPLGPWVKGQVGIGLKQGARLIAAIGDPAWNYAEDRPRRGPAELWAYCGYAPGQKRQKGVRSNWNAQAKMRAYLIAESCIKHSHSPYRKVYDAARAAWVDRDTSDGHKHNHALRLVAKAILKDLWREARRLRSSSGDHAPFEPSPAETREAVAV